MSRSEFCPLAAQRYLEELDSTSLTAQIDQAVASLDGVDEAQRAAVAVGRRVLAEL